MKVLGIETSCDETGVAVYETEHGVLSNTLFSQIELHKAYGGVIPELASRSQLEKIRPITELSLKQAHVSPDNLDAVAVTYRPGLPGSLLVGLCFAKALSYASNIPLIGVNHLEAHAYSAYIEHKVPFPALTLTASGGHTALYLLEGFGRYSILGQTLDDAAGEAFDKVAKLINLPYPGGPSIEKLAAQVGFKDFFHYPRSRLDTLDFSFSGLKTAVMYDLVNRNAYDMETKTFLQNNNLELKQHVASSLIRCIADIFALQLERALAMYTQVQAVTFVGGVACNTYIREHLKTVSQKYRLPFFVPSKQYCTDNGAMVAFVGHYKAQKNEWSDLTLDIY